MLEDFMGQCFHVAGVHCLGYSAELWGDCVGLLLDECYQKFLRACGNRSRLGYDAFWLAIRKDSQEDWPSTYLGLNTLDFFQPQNQNQNFHRITN
jgi:hypothetical protein